MYISADIEADGPIPGVYSMLAFGLAVAGPFDGVEFVVCDPTAATFERELRPITNRFLVEAGVTRAQIDEMTIANPRRFFGG